VVHVIANDREQVLDARGEISERGSEIWKSVREPLDAVPLEGCVVRDNRPRAGAGIEQRLGERTARIGRAVGEPRVVDERAILLLDVAAELDGDRS
jgi:hypothetical protein